MIFIEILGTPLGIFLVALLGLLVGSFLNVVIYRIPVMIDREDKLLAWEIVHGEGERHPEVAEGRFNLLTPPSRCPNCGHQIRAWENIPVVSYLLQGRKCKACRRPISSRYAIVELLSAFASAVIAWRIQAPLPLLFALLFTWALIALIFIDAETSLLPDRITLPLMWLGIFAAWLGTGHNQGLFISLSDSVLGAMLGYLSLWSVYWLFKLLTGREGMGYGDFKLLAALLAWQGVIMLPIILMVSSICGIVFFMINKIGFGKPAPFGPYLAVAGWLTFLFGGQIAAFLSFLPN